MIVADQNMKNVVDVASAATVVSALAGWLPTGAALLGIIWYAIQIWESKTVQDFIARHRRKP